MPSHSSCCSVLHTPEGHWADEKGCVLQGTEPYEVGPDLLAAQRLPVIKAPSGMAFGGEAGPDPSKFDIMNADDFGIWQNRTMAHSDTAAAEQSTIPGYALGIPYGRCGKSVQGPPLCAQECLPCCRPIQPDILRPGLEIATVALQTLRQHLYRRLSLGCVG